MNDLTMFEAMMERERGGRGPDDPFTANRNEAVRELDWERLSRRSEALAVVVRGPRHLAPGELPVVS